jgi:hypothetical protein
MGSTFSTDWDVTADVNLFVLDFVRNRACEESTACGLLVSYDFRLFVRGVPLNPSTSSENARLDHGISAVSQDSSWSTMIKITGSFLLATCI